MFSDYNMEINGNTTDEMKLNMAGNHGNLPDICNHENTDINLSGGVDVNGVDINGVETIREMAVDVPSEIDIKPMESSVNFAAKPPSIDGDGADTKGGISIDVSGEVGIKPMETSVNFADKPPSTDEPSRNELFSALADIGDISYDTDLSFDTSDPAVDVDVDHDPVVLQQIHDSDVCVHAAVAVEPSFDIGDKLAALYVDTPDVPGQPLEVNVAMDGQGPPKLGKSPPN